MIPNFLDILERIASMEELTDISPNILLKAESATRVIIEETSNVQNIFIQNN